MTTKEPEYQPPSFPEFQDRTPTLDEIKATLKEYLYLKDDGVIDIAVASVISSRLADAESPTWLALVAESSGGKTEIIELFSKLQAKEFNLVYKLSDLTPQTFVSGALNSVKETSLLQRVNGKVLLFKDFTTILQKNRDSQKEILSQLREIYDGEFNKDFGTGKSVKWKGRVGCVVCMTPPALELMSQHSSMGERFIVYYIDQPTDQELADILRSNEDKDVRALKDRAATMMAMYVAKMVQLAEETKVNLHKECPGLVEEINLVAQFATRARSPIQVDFRTSEPTSIPSVERFPRFAKSMINLAKAMYIMNGMVGLTQTQKRALFSIALGSIPRTRKAVMFVVAQYRLVTTAGCAARLGFTTPVMRGQLAQLASLNIIIRIPNGGPANSDAWKMMPKYVALMEKYAGITQRDEDLFNEDDIEIEDSGFSDEAEQKKTQEELNKLRDEAQIAEIVRKNPSMSYDEAKEYWLNEGKAIAESGDDF